MCPVAYADTPKNDPSVANQYYVLANSVLADHDTRVLKQGETFAVFDPYGDVNSALNSEAGIFHRGTRYLSRSEFCISQAQRPLLLNSTLRDDNGLLKVEMTNPEMEAGATRSGKIGHRSEFALQKGSIHIQREKFLLDDQCHERVSIENFSAREIHLEVVFTVDADFADIFEVRGNQRALRGTRGPISTSATGVRMSYTGLDRVRRTTSISIHDTPAEICGISSGGVQFRIPLHIQSKRSVQFLIEITFSEGVSERVAASDDTCHFRAGLTRVKDLHNLGKSRFCQVKTSNERFESWLQRSTDDLVMMTTETPEGHLYPYAGIPWFCAAFGRDGIITALECLWANPELSKGVLQLLADTQAKEKNPAQDATPGKIIHEVRFGEMAALKEIPFGKYYGSIDSTPLFVCLAGAYFTRTGDLGLIESIWTELELALNWMEHYGDSDQDGFIEYQRENADGLVQQGWKDSHDSIFHENGEDAVGPIALAEVQGYCYMAYVEGARLAHATGRDTLVSTFSKKAEQLKIRFDQKFWLEDLGTYALALDGKKNPCRVASSNAGQCLFTGIVRPERAAQLVKTLMGPESFSGWGIRTVATSAARYNPMSYHNGSVWPHDTALVALGMAKMGFKVEAERIFNGLFRSANYMSLYRMPEVYCGFIKRDGEAPTLYPNACSPQAWAAGAVYMLLQALLGLQISAEDKHVRFCKPRLPESLESVKLSGLRVGDANLDLVVQNYHSDVSVQIVRRSGDVSVTVEK